MTTNNHLNVTEQEWENEARLGVFASLAFSRRILSRGGALTTEERAGLVETLLLMEEFVGKVWVPGFVQRARRRNPNRKPVAPSVTEGSTEPVDQEIQKGGEQGERLVTTLREFRKTMYLSSRLAQQAKFKSICGGKA